MALNNDLIKLILKNLIDARPEGIEKMEGVVADHKNLEEVGEHLFYLHSRGRVEFINLESSTRKYCYNIKITGLGEAYYDSLP